MHRSVAFPLGATVVAATFLGLLFVPFFVVVTRSANRRTAAGRAAAVTSAAE